MNRLENRKIRTRLVIIWSAAVLLGIACFTILSLQSFLKPGGNSTSRNHSLETFVFDPDEEDADNNTLLPLSLTLSYAVLSGAFLVIVKYCHIGPRQLRTARTGKVPLFIAHNVIRL